MIFGGGDQVDELSHLRLVSRLMEKLEEVNIVALLSKMTLDKVVNRRLEHERVVYGDDPDFRVLVPARLPPTGDGRVHDIVGYKEKRLQLSGRQRGRAYPGWDEMRFTSSTHQPRIAAFSYSSSVKVVPLRTSSESTTEMPLFSFPPGTL